jgi:uncharacterized membrane protein HdeD (DUF308 family)
MESHERYPVKKDQRKVQIKRIVYYVLGTIEVLFALRLILKVLGANPQSSFASLLYSVTALFMAPFNGIFRTAVSQGLETQSVLEPALLIAMLVYALLAWGIVKLMYTVSSHNEH